MDIRKLLGGAGRFATAMVDPEFERRKAAEEAKLALSKAQLGQTEAQTGLIGAETRRAEAGTATEGLRGQEIQSRLDEIKRARDEWDAAVKAGTLKGANAEVQKAIIDAAEADVRKTANEAAAEASRASAAHSRASTRWMEDPTRRALELAQLRDLMRYRHAQTAATEALTENRERGPARSPNMDLQARAQAYAEANVNKGRSGVIARFFGSDNQPLLDENSPEYMREIARLKQEFYQANPETAGGWTAAGGPAGGGNLSTGATPGSFAGAANLPDGVYTDSTTGQLFAVRGGKVLELRDQNARPGGLGVPGASVNPENDY